MNYTFSRYSDGVYELTTSRVCSGLYCQAAMEWLKKNFDEIDVPPCTSANEDAAKENLIRLGFSVTEAPGSPVHSPRNVIQRGKIKWLVSDFGLIVMSWALTQTAGAVGPDAPDLAAKELWRLVRRAIITLRDNNVTVEVDGKRVPISCLKVELPVVSVLHKEI